MRCRGTRPRGRARPGAPAAPRARPPAACCARGSCRRGCPPTACTAPSWSRALQRASRAGWWRSWRAPATARPRCWPRRSSPPTACLGVVLVRRARRRSGGAARARRGGDPGALPGLRHAAAARGLCGGRRRPRSATRSSMTVVRRLRAGARRRPPAAAGRRSTALRLLVGPPAAQRPPGPRRPGAPALPRSRGAAGRVHRDRRGPPGVRPRRGGRARALAGRRRPTTTPSPGSTSAPRAGLAGLIRGARPVPGHHVGRRERRAVRLPGRGGARPAAPTRCSEFLLDTSVLGRFSPELAAAGQRARGRRRASRDAASPAPVRGPLAAEGEWYRYHHLLQAFLQGRLRERDPERLREPASEGRPAWWAAEGQPAEAVRHLLEAGRAGGRGGCDRAGRGADGA